MFDRFSQQELQILKERARRIAVDKSQDKETELISVLRCKVGREWYAVPLEKLTAIHHHATVVPVPGTPDFFKGISNVRGRILSVLGLAELLGVDHESEESELILVNHQNEPVAFQVDHVEGARAYEAKDVETVPTEVQTEVISTCFSDGTLIIEFEVLLTSSQLIINV